MKIKAYCTKCKEHTALENVTIAFGEGMSVLGKCTKCEEQVIFGLAGLYETSIPETAFGVKRDKNRERI